MLAYSDTSTYNGIIQEEERIVYSSDYGRISGNTKELATWTVRNNHALKRATALMSEYAGRWRFGDWNHGSYDTATQNIVANTREVAITNPQDVLFIFGVQIKIDTTTTLWTEIQPLDIREKSSLAFREDNTTNRGIPSRYEKVGGYIVLDPEPNYAVTNGLRYYYQRSPHDFATSDTSAVAGIPSLFDRIIPLYAIDIYATENTNTNLKQLVGVDIARMERDVKNFFAMREQDRELLLTVPKRSSR